jgi:hypothetical protein
MRLLTSAGLRLSSSFPRPGAAAALLCWVSWAGCASADEVSEREQAGRTQLANIDARIAAAEAALREKQQLVEAAAADARFFECKASVERLDAEVSLAHTQCLQQLAAESKCEVVEERKKGDATLLGCIVGIAVAVGSSGAAFEYALAGCAGGRLTGEALAQRCGKSDCLARLPEVEQELRARRGWTDLPQCGGLLGAILETPLVQVPFGVEVTEAGRLAAAGIAQGDAILFVNGRIAFSAADFGRLLDNYAAQEANVHFVRAGQLYEGRLSIPGVPSSLEARVQSVRSIEYRQGARIVSAEPRLVQIEPRLVGATVATLDGEAIRSVDQFRSLLRYRRGGESVTLGLIFAGDTDPQPRSFELRERVPGDRP